MLNEKVEDPLTYQDYSFEMEEWSNIPSLVPKFIIHLNNHLKALIQHCKYKSEEEPSDSLRRDVFFNFEKRDLEMGEFRKVDQYQHNKIEMTCKDLKNDIENIEENIQLEKRSQEKQAKQSVASFFHAKVEDFENEFDPNDKSSFICDQDTHKEARTFSIQQLKNLINFGIAKSRVKRRVSNSETQIENIKKQLLEIFDWKQDIEKRMSFKFDEVNDSLDKSNKQHLKHVDDTSRKCYELLEKHNSNAYKLSKHQEFHDENFVFQEVIQSRCNHLNDKIKKLRDNTKEDMELQSKSIVQKMDDNINELNQTLIFARKEIERLKTDLTDILEMKHEQVIQQMELEVSQIQTMFDDLKHQQDKFREDLIKKNKTRIMKIKDICGNFFERTEKLTNKNAASVLEIENTFENWKLNVMKPALLAEARLFAIETQLQEDENDRIAEFQYTKDILKKLVFALDNQINRLNFEQTQTIQSPSILLNVSTTDELDVQKSNILNNGSNIHSKSDLPTVILQQPKFQFGSPNEAKTNLSNYQSITNRRHSQSRKISRAYDQSQSFVSERTPAYSVFKQRIQFIKSALDQDAILIPQFKQKIPLKHKDNFKVNFMHETSINDSIIERPVFDNTSPSLTSDNLIQDSIQNEQTDPQLRPFLRSKQQSNLTSGKLSPQNIKIQSLLTNIESKRMTINPLNKFKFNNLQEHSQNQHPVQQDIFSPKGGLTISFTQQSNFKTISSTDNNTGANKPKLTPIYHQQIEQIDSTLREHQIRLEKELNEKRVHKRTKNKSEIREHQTINLDPINSKRF